MCGLSSPLHSSITSQYIPIASFNSVTFRNSSATLSPNQLGVPGAASYEAQRLFHANFAWPTLPVIKTSRYLERFYWNLPEQHREVVNQKEDIWMIHGEGAECCLHSLWEGVLAVWDSDGGTLFLPESKVQSMNKTVYTTEGWGHIKIIWSNDNLQLSGMHWGCCWAPRVTR